MGRATSSAAHVLCSCSRECVTLTWNSSYSVRALLDQLAHCIFAPTHCKLSVPLAYLQSISAPAPCISHTFCEKRAEYTEFWRGAAGEEMGKQLRDKDFEESRNLMMVASGSQSLRKPIKRVTSPSGNQVNCIGQPSGKPRRCPSFAHPRLIRFSRQGTPRPAFV
jgi:hypothetical protein